MGCGLESLCTLALSENNIKLLEGLSTLTNLTTLNLSKNSIENAASIEHLAECNNLSAVDLSHNQLAGANIELSSHALKFNFEVTLHLKMLFLFYFYVSGGASSTLFLYMQQHGLTSVEITTAKGS
jgi:Leucine-rich repeat (LRR) protein